MTIIRARQVPAQVDGFIAGAPDAKSSLSAQAEAPGLKTKRGNSRSQVSVVLPDALLAKLDVEAKCRFMSRSGLITMVINRFLEESSR